MKTMVAVVLAAGLAAHAQVATWERPVPQPVEKYVTLEAVGDYTAPSLGVFTSHQVIWQADTWSPGVGADWEMWKRGSGLVAGLNYTRTSAEIFDLNKTLLTSWKLDRYKMDALFEHRFRAGRTFRPYLGIGGWMVVLWGGPAPAHSGVNHTGWDALGGVAVPVGISTRLTDRIALKTGGVVNFGKSTTYGDTTFTASQTVFYETKVGLTVRLGKVGP